jgi:hypothetical protein
LVRVFNRFYRDKKVVGCLCAFCAAEIVSLAVLSLLQPGCGPDGMCFVSNLAHQQEPY